MRYVLCDIWHKIDYCSFILFLIVAIGGGGDDDDDYDDDFNSIIRY